MALGCAPTLTRHLIVPIIAVAFVVGNVELLHGLSGLGDVVQVLVDMIINLRVLTDCLRKCRIFKFGL